MNKKKFKSKNVKNIIISNNLVDYRMICDYIKYKYNL